MSSMYASFWDSIFTLKFLGFFQPPSSTKDIHHERASSSPSCTPNLDSTTTASPVTSGHKRRRTDPSSRPPYDHLATDYAHGTVHVDIMLGPNMMVQTIPASFSTSGKTRRRREAIPLEFRTERKQDRQHHHHRRRREGSDTGATAPPSDAAT